MFYMFLEDEVSTILGLAFFAFKNMKSPGLK